MVKHSPTLRIGSFLAAAILLIANSTQGQVPEKFSNLQLFPKDISKAELMQNMRSFSFALNVRCSHCHVQRSEKELDLDYAADDKQTKKTARIMLMMVAAINRDWVGQVSDHQPVGVECVTCHHGLAQPKTLKIVLTEAFDKQGIAGAVALYRDLRGRYYGTGEYDFGETQMNQLAETLLHSNKTKEAAALMELNFDANHPTSVWSYHVLAMSHEANGEKEKARQDYAKVIELHPEDGWAKQQLELMSRKK